MVGDFALNEATEVRPLDPEPDWRYRASKDTGRRGPRGEVVRLYPCDNCGRRHWGYVEVHPGGPWGPPEYDFVATDPRGNARTWRRDDGTVDPNRGGWAPCL